MNSKNVAKYIFYSIDIFIAIIFSAFIFFVFIPFFCKLFPSDWSRLLTVITYVLVGGFLGVIIPFRIIYWGIKIINISAKQVK